MYIRQHLVREKGVTTLRIKIELFHHYTVIETCFEIIKEHEKLGRYSNYKSKIFKIVLKLDQLIPLFDFTNRF